MMLGALPQMAVRRPSEEKQSASQYQKSTHRANSSVHSREAQVANHHRTPDQAAKQSIISIGRQQQMLNTGVVRPDHRSLASMQDNHPYLSLSVKQAKQDF